MLQKHEWKDDYSVNIESIDEQHKKFIEIINLLIDVVNKKHCNSRVADVFFSLAYYAEHYFINEEILFKDYQYPNLTQHKELHNNFILRIIQFQKEFEADKENVCEELLGYLEDWFKEHILQYDKSASDFLKEHGIK
jgi:hemerythrin-like metal-binding protein